MASQDIGVLGPHESEPVYQDWSLLYSLPRGLLWMVLILLFLRKSNRKANAWAVLVPLLAIYLIWLIVRQMLPMPSQVIVMLGQIVASMAMMLAIVWLLADRLAFSDRLLTFFSAAVVMVVFACLGPICDSGMYLGAGQVTLIATIISGISALVLLVALTITAFLCRKRYSHWPFILWLLLWTIFTIMAPLFAYGAVIIGAVTGGLSVFARIIQQVLMMGGILGVILYLIVLPYMILAFRSPFYYARLYACFRLEGMATCRIKVNPQMADLMLANHD